MWSSKSRALLRSLRASRPRIQPQVPSKTLTLIPSLPSRWSPNPRFFSSHPNFDPPPHENPTWDAFPSNADDDCEKVENLGEFPEENTVDEAEAPEIDPEQIESVVSVLKSSTGDSMESGLDKLQLTLSEEFVAKAIEASDAAGVNPMAFFKWALKNDECVKTSRAVQLFVRSVSNSTELTKMEAYALWDLVKELGKEKGFLNTEILNELIAMFSKLEKGKAALEVFEMFDDFGCCADGNTYYYTIEALGKRSMFDAGCGVCENMISAGILPDGPQIGKIVKFLCRGKKVKEAHLVYLTAKEKNVSQLALCLDPLVCGLAKCDETVPLALELLNDYPKGSSKYANKVFGSVVKGLCRIKNVQEAKELLLRMVNSGPTPGSAAFNYVITLLSKEGEMEDAVALLKLMGSRGLRPDIYSYTVVMSGFAKGGLIDEAYKIYTEAKKNHDKLSPATYHVLIRGYCKMEDYKKALECMNEMKQDGVQPNADEYDKMIQTLCLKALDWRKAKELLDEVSERGLYLKGTTRSLVAAVKELEEEATQEEGVVSASTLY